MDQCLLSGMHACEEVQIYENIEVSNSFTKSFWIPFLTIFPFSGEQRGIAYRLHNPSRFSLSANSCCFRTLSLQWHC